MRPGSRSLRTLTGALALLSLGGCLAAPLAFFLGRLSERGFKTSFLVASIGWFVFSVARKALAPGGSASSPGAL